MNCIDCRQDYNAIDNQYVIHSTHLSHRQSWAFLDSIHQSQNKANNYFADDF